MRRQKAEINSQDYHGWHRQGKGAISNFTSPRVVAEFQEAMANDFGKKTPSPPPAQQQRTPSPPKEDAIAGYYKGTPIFPSNGMYYYVGADGIKHQCGPPTQSSSSGSAQASSSATASSSQAAASGSSSSSASSNQPAGRHTRARVEEVRGFKLLPKFS